MESVARGRNVVTPPRARFVGLGLALWAVVAASCADPDAGDRTPERGLAPRIGDSVPALASMVLVHADPGQRISLTNRWSESLRGSFYFDEFEVTHGEFAAFLRDSEYVPSSDALQSLWRGSEPPPALADHPVVFVTASDAEAFAAHHGKRLPTVAEWHRAALRTNDDFPWTGPFHKNKCNSIELGLDATTIVGTFESGKSFWGAYDVFGNVWEWTSTEKNLAEVANVADPWRRGRVVVGGAFDSWVSPRSRSLPWLQVEQPGNWTRSLGFRCVRDVDEAIVRAVIEVARRGSASARREAVHHLRQYNDDLAIPALEAVATDDEDPEVREIAVRALIGPGAPPAVSSAALRRILGENIDPLLRVEAARVLANRGEESGVAALRDALGNAPQSDVRQHAFASLIALDNAGDAHSIAESLRAESDPHVRAAMVSALIERMDPASPLFEPILRAIAADSSVDVRSRFVRGLGGRNATGEAAGLVALMAVSDPEPAVRMEAIRALDSDVDSLEAAVVRGLSATGGEPDERVRAVLADEAFRLRRRLVAPEPLAVLRSAASADGSELVRAAIVRTLIQALRDGVDSGGAILDTVIAAAVSDASPSVREEAARGLASIGNEAAFERLAERLRPGAEPDETVLAAVLDAAARCGGENALSAVSARVADPSAIVSVAAARALVYCGARGIEMADAAATAALAAQPDDLEALLQKARVAARKGNEEDATSYILRVETMLSVADVPRSLYDLGLEDDTLLGPLIDKKWND